MVTVFFTKGGIIETFFLDKSKTDTSEYAGSSERSCEWKWRIFFSSSEKLTFEIENVIF